MLTAIAEFAVRRRRTVLLGSLALFIVAAVFGGDVEQHLSRGGFEDPDSESTRAAQVLSDEFNAGPPNVVLLVEARNGSVDAPDVAAAGLALTRELEGESAVAEAVSYWSLGNVPPLKSGTGDKALVLGRISGDQNEVIDQIEALSPRYTRAAGPVTVRVAGAAETSREVAEILEHDIVKAEAIALPITLLLLIIVFGSVVSAVLPVAMGALAILGTFLILRLVGSVTEVSVYSLSMTTAMGLALAIDYSLCVVSRYREELRHGLDTADAVVRTVQTAGRTVAIGGMTVAISLAVLAIFPLAFLRSFAYAGIAVVGFAVFGAIVALPAALAALGPRVDRFSWRRNRGDLERREQFWHRAALLVMRRPLTIAAAVVAILLLLGAPFLDARFGLPDDRVLPPGSDVRAVHDELRRDFSSQEAGALSVVATGTGDPTARGPEVVNYAKSLSVIGGVARVDSAFGVFVRGEQALPASPLLAQRFARPDGTWLSVVPSVEPISSEAEALVRQVRDADAPFPVMVAGSSAQLVDSKASLFGRMPMAAGLIALITFTCLFLMFGSVLVPAKAVVLNVLSLTAMFGAMVWIFQDGHLSGLLDFTATGFLTTTIPVLMFCGAFGLSMDYEVFLLSRIKEEHDLGADNETAVAAGLERTGRIVTAAAVLMAIVFVAFATSGISFMKLFGIGMTTAVLMDATLIRAALVPAFMRLAGDANWWAPAPLRRVYDRWGIRETATAPIPEPSLARRNYG
jgi:putative drug exporter of the RND superfamily